MPKTPAVSRRVLLLVAPALFALVAAWSLMHYATGGRVAYTMDSLTYRDAALNFAAGHPAQATNVTAPLPERRPLLVWPPAYPALWASAAHLSGRDIDDVLAVLNPVLLGIGTLGMFWICSMVTGRPAVAGLLAAASAFAPTTLLVYGHAWSETLFIPLLLLAYATLWKYLQSRESLGWLAAAAILIGLANWTRYAGVAFLPLLGFSVLAASGARFGRRLAHATGAVLLGVLIAAPLWLHNWRLSGNISGSARGGVPRGERWLEDAQSIVDLFEHSFFAFSMLLRAHLELPLIVAAVVLAGRTFILRGARWVLAPRIFLPIAWLTAYLLFLLYARTIQAEVPMDLRMLAVAFPFLLIALAPTLDTASPSRPFEARQALIFALLGLLIYSGSNEAHRTHENYASAGVPRWRSVFGLAFHDLRDTATSSRALKASIGPTDASTLILTDYRALHVRYLTGARAYSPADDGVCAQWHGDEPAGIVLIGARQLPKWAVSCLEQNPHWRLLRPTGRAAPSMHAD